MSDLWLGAVSKLESVLPMEGPMAVPARAAIGAGVGYVLMEAIRPGFAYTEDGKKRPDTYFPQLYSSGGKPTALPWYSGPILGAVAFSTFI